MRAPVKLRRPVAAVALCLALVAGAAACSSSSSSGDSSTTTTAAPNGTAASGSGDAQALMGLLLTGSEMGTGYSADNPEVKQASGTPSPCGSPSPDATFPPEQSVSVTAANGTTNVIVVETIHVYPSASEATGAMAIGTAGLSCGTGALPGGQTFTISAPIDLTAQVGTEARGWDVTMGAEPMAMVVAIVDDTMVTVEMLGPDAATLTAADPIRIAQAAVAKYEAG